MWPHTSYKKKINILYTYRKYIILIDLQSKNIIYITIKTKFKISLNIIKIALVKDNFNLNSFLLICTMKNVLECFIIFSSFLTEQNFFY